MSESKKGSLCEAELAREEEEAELVRRLSEELESYRLAGERLRGQYNAAVTDRDRVQRELDGARDLLHLRSKVLDAEIGRFKSRLTCDHAGCKNQIGLPVELGDAKRWMLLDVLDWTEDADGHHHCHDHSGLTVKSFTNDQDKHL